MTAPVALVTGAARGIGAAVVAELAALGWAVAATDVCADDPALGYQLGTREELAAVAANSPGEVIDIVADVRDRKTLEDVASQVVDRFGRLDAAVAVAGVLSTGPEAWHTTNDAWDIQMDVNLRGVWHLACATVPSLIEFCGSSPVGHTSFVGISSAAGLRGLPLLAAYSASKHGVIGLIRSMAAELGHTGVTANVVAPGSTTTPLLEASAKVYGLDDTAEFKQHHLLNRLVDPADIAGAVGYLCGPGGTSITGAVIPVDAGMGAK